MAAKMLAKPGMVVELVKGDYWYDDISEVKLERGLYKMATTKEMKDKDIAQKGYIKLEKEPLPTATIPKDIEEEKLVRVEKALRLGILKTFDTKKPTEYKEHKTAPMAVYDDKESKGFRYTDEDNNMISDLLSKKLPEFKSTIKKFKTLSMLDKIYDAEWAGRNALSRARKGYIDAIKAQMKAKDVQGIGKIRSEKDKTVKITLDE